MIGLLLTAAQLQMAVEQTPVDYLVAAVMDGQTCLFRATDVGLTAKQFTEALRDYNKGNGIQLIYRPGVPSRCLQAGRKAALAAGFTRVTVRPERDEDIVDGRTP